MDHRFENSKSHRSGTTLVELLIVITVLTFLLAIVAVVTHTLSRSHRTTRAEVDVRRALARLSLQFRADGHAAKAVAQPEAGGEAGIELTMAGANPDVVRYRILADPARIERTALDADAAIGRDTYRLPRGVSVAFETSTEVSPRVLALVISWPVGEPPDRAERTLRIEAAMGLHARLSGEPIEASEVNE